MSLYDLANLTDSLPPEHALSRISVEVDELFSKKYRPEFLYLGRDEMKEVVGFLKEHQIFVDAEGMATDATGTLPMCLNGAILVSVKKDKYLRVEASRFVTIEVEREALVDLVRINDSLLQGLIQASPSALSGGIGATAFRNIVSHVAAMKSMLERIMT